MLSASSPQIFHSRFSSDLANVRLSPVCPMSAAGISTVVFAGSMPVGV